MDKDKLIVKQQLEIEELKERIAEYKDTISDVRKYLWMPEQWSPRCPDFPRVAMKGIVQSIRAIDGL